MDILERAIEKAKEERISTLVVASTTGDAAFRLFKLIKDKGLHLIVVTHDEGRPRNEWRFNEDIRRLLLANNVIVYTHNMPMLVLRKIMERVLEKLGLLPWRKHLNKIKEEYGTGIKVCHIILKMLMESRILKVDKIIAIAGERKGANGAAIFLVRRQDKWPVLEEIIKANP